MRASDVFKPQGVPTITLVREPVSAAASQAFDDAIEEGGRLIRVVGPSKAGKTVFVMTKAPEGVEVLRVSVSGIANGSELWNRVLARAKAIASCQVTTSAGGTLMAEVGGKAEGGVPLLARASAETKLQAQAALSRSTSITNAVDPLQTIVDLFAKKPIWLFIDDFHYSSTAVQIELAEQIKHASEEGVQVLIALIPGRSQDILKANNDLQGRILDIEFAYWSVEELSAIARLGFPELNIRLLPGGGDRLAREAAGTPQLMQSICLALARDVGARMGPLDPARTIDVDDELITRICGIVAQSNSDLSETLEQMRMGPAQRGTTRKIYTDNEMNECDVYQLIVRAFGMNPPAMRFTSLELQSRVNSLVGEQVANLWASVGNITERANVPGREKKLDFGGDLRWVAVLDPYLWFAIRWLRP